MSKLIATSLFTVVALGATVVSQSTQVAPADLVLRGGKIVTLDAQTPEGTALASRNGAIVAVGTDAAIARYIGPSTQVIDLAGRLAIPGFIEGHGHFNGIGEGKLNLDLMATKSWDEIVHMVAMAVETAKPGEWIIGRGWHQEKWTSTPNPSVEGFPTHLSLDKVSPNNPVILTHASGHASFANAKALELSNITKTTANPFGGEILKDKDGNPTGLLRETASGLVRRGAGAPRPTPEEVEARADKALLLADQESISKGITSFQDAGSSFELVNRVKRLIDEGKMNVRLWFMIRTSWRAADVAASTQALKAGRVVGYGNNQLTVRAIKITGDGALGSRGAWLLEPYADKADSVGAASTPLEVRVIRSAGTPSARHWRSMSAEIAAKASLRRMARRRCSNPPVRASSSASP